MQARLQHSVGGDFGNHCARCLIVCWLYFFCPTICQGRNEWRKQQCPPLQTERDIMNDGMNDVVWKKSWQLGLGHLSLYCKLLYDFWFPGNLEQDPLIWSRPLFLFKRSCFEFDLFHHTPPCSSSSVTGFCRARLVVWKPSFETPLA